MPEAKELRIALPVNLPEEEAKLLLAIKSYELSKVSLGRRPNSQAIPNARSLKY